MEVESLDLQVETKSLNFLANFPYLTPRQVQIEILQVLQDNWNKFDVFTISAPTALGKSSLAKSIMDTVYSASYCAPTNLLVDQFRKEFPETRTLSRLDKYHCKEWNRPCVVTKARLHTFCKGCTCGSDLAQAKYKSGPGAYNYHIYLAHQLYRDVLIMDEAHTAQSIIKDRLSITLWRHDYKWSSNMKSNEQILEWIRTLSPAKQKSKKITKLREAVTYKVPEFIHEFTRDWFNGKGTIRGEPEERECIKLRPVDISQAPPMLWPPQVKKIVMLSGTISKKDVEQLGLTRKRILHIEGKSPIPAENRPIYFEPVVSVTRNNYEDAVPQLADYIQYVASQYTGKKGLVHATYQLAADLKQHLEHDPRYIFHTKEDKADRYKEFMESNWRLGKVLVASGLYEGIDLPEDAGRWQIIAKVPWASLGNPAIKHLAELDPELFNWETIKTLVQAAGRICRTPKDYGDTFIPDTSFLRLYKDAKHLFPQYFLEALNFIE